MVPSDSLQKSYQLLSFLDHYRKQVVKGDYFKRELELGKTLGFLKDPTSFLKAKVTFKGLAWRGGISRCHTGTAGPPNPVFTATQEPRQSLGDETHFSERLEAETGNSSERK